MNETIQGPVLRECGNNPLPDGNTVSRVDMSKTGLFQRIVKPFRAAEAPPPVPKPRPQISPEEELKQLRGRLSHFTAQFATAQKNVEDGRAAPIAGGNVLAQKQRYAEWLSAGRDIAGEPWVDANLLLSVLNDRYGVGLIPATKSRIIELEGQQRINAFETENAPAREKARIRLGKAALELSAAFEAAQEVFRFPVGPCLKGVPTDVLKAIHDRLKNVKGIDDLL